MKESTKIFCVYLWLSCLWRRFWSREIFTNSLVIDLYTKHSLFTFIIFIFVWLFAFFYEICKGYNFCESRIYGKKTCRKSNKWIIRFSTHLLCGKAFQLLWVKLGLRPWKRYEYLYAYSLPISPSLLVFDSKNWTDVTMNAYIG